MRPFFFAVMALMLATLLTLSGCGGEPATTEETASETGDAAPVEIDTDIEPEPETEALNPSVDISIDDPDYADLPKVMIETDLGPITVALFPEEAPVTVRNFLDYVRGRQYTRTVFHRVIPGFMIQGGGFSTFLEQRGTNDPIPYEGDNGLKNQRGTIAMARLNDPDSATAQWYINLVNNAGLDHGARGQNVPGYTVLGWVMMGMNIVDAIASTPTTEKIAPSGQPLPNAPVENIVISQITIIDEGMTDETDAGEENGEMMSEDNPDQ